MKQLGVLLLTSLDQIPVHPMVTPTPPLLAFHQASLTNIWYQFILLGGDWALWERSVLHKNKTHWPGQVTNADLLILSPTQARLQMQTSWPWVQHRPGYKCRPLNPESTSLIIVCLRGRLYWDSNTWLFGSHQQSNIHWGFNRKVR